MIKSDDLAALSALGSEGTIDVLERMIAQYEVAGDSTAAESVRLLKSGFIKGLCERFSDHGI